MGSQVFRAGGLASVMGLVVLFIALGLPAPAASADDATSCRQAKGDAAIAACDHAIASGTFKGSDLAGLYASRGAAYTAAGDYNRAVQDFDQAVSLDPNDAAAFNGRGVVRSAERDYERAIKDYDQAIRLDANYGWALNNRGEAYIMKGEYDRAIQDLD